MNCVLPFVSSCTDHFDKGCSSFSHAATAVLGTRMPLRHCLQRLLRYESFVLILTIGSAWPVLHSTDCRI